MAAVNEAPEPSYLYRIITDALSLNPSPAIQNSDTAHEKYQTIGNYDVSNYEEKPFDTKIDD